MRKEDRIDTCGLHPAQEQRPRSRVCQWKPVNDSHASDKYPRREGMLEAHHRRDGNMTSVTSDDVHGLHDD